METVWGDAAGYYATAGGGERLSCATCGTAFALADRFTSDGETSLHWRPECDPDWKPDRRPSLLRRLLGRA